MAFGIGGLFATGAADAAIYWSGASAGDWSVANNWVDTDGGANHPASAPGSGQDVVFNTSGLNTAMTINLNLVAGGTTQAANSLTFRSTGTELLQGGGVANQTLTIGTGGITVNAGANTVTIGSATASQNVNIALNASQNWANNSANALAIKNNVTNVADAAPYTLTFNGAGTGGVTISGIISNGGSTGTTALVVNQNVGAVTLTAANSFTGGASLNGGTFNLNASGASGNGNFTINGGVLDNTVNTSQSTVTLNNNSYTWAGDFTFNGSNPGPNYYGNNRITFGGSGAVTLTGGNRAVNVNAGILTVTNSIGDGGNGYRLTKNGPGMMVLASSNSFSGGMILNAGTLKLGNAGSLGTGTLIINGGTIDNNSATALTLNNTVQTWRGDFSFGGTGPLNLGTGAISLGELAGTMRTVTVAGSTLTVGGIISNGTTVNSLDKSGAGTLVLNGANAYTGGTVIDGGFLQFGAGAVPSTGLITINSAGTLYSNGAFSGVTNALTKIAANSTGNIALVANSSENIDFTGYTGLMLGAQAASTYTGTLTPAGTTYRLGGGGQALTLSNTNAITGVVGNSLVVGTFGAAGTVVLSGSNDLGGTTTVNSGVLKLSTFTGAVPNSDVTLNNNTTLAIDSASGTAAASVTRANSVTLNNSTLTVAGSGTGNTVDAITNILTLNSGYNTITVTPNAAKSAELSAASLFRSAATTGMVNGTNLGAYAYTSGSANMGNIILATTPTLVGAGTTSGGINAAQKTTGIISYLVGESGTTTLTGKGTATGVANTFLTYDTTAGLRPLNPTDEFTNNSIAAGNNTRITAATTAATTASINSLVMASGTLTITDGQSLTNTSGALLFAAASTIAPSSSTGALDFGSTEGIVTVNSGVTGTISAKLTGSGGLTKSGAGILLISSANNGTTTIAGGAITVSVAGALGSDASAVLLGATGGAANTSLSGNKTITIARNIIVQGGNNGIATLSNNDGNNSGFITTFSGNITLGTAGATAGTGVAHGVTLTASQNDHATFSGIIADPVNLGGTPGLVTIGTGANSVTNITLTGNNTFAGGIMFAGGNLWVNSSNSVGTGPITINGGSSIAVVGAGSVTLSNNITVGGNFGVPNNGGNLTLSGSLSLTGNRAISITNSTLTISGVISDSIPGSNFGLTFNNGSTATAGDTLTLSGLNTFDGGLTLTNPTAGTVMGLKIGNLGNATASAIGTGTLTIGGAAGTSSVLTTINLDSSVAGNGALGTNNAQVWNSDFTFVGTNSLNMGTGAASLGVLSGTSRTVTVAANTLTIGGVISNGTNLTSPTSNLIKAGAGTLALSGSNTYSGGTTVSAGTLAGTTTGLQGTIVNNATVAFDQTLPSTPISSGTFTGTINGTGAVAKNNAGTVVLTTANGYTGQTTINGGVLSISDNSQIGAVATGATLNLNGGTLQARTTVALDNSGANQRLVKLTGASGGTFDVLPSANLTVSGVVSGTGSLTKTSAGTLTLTGSNTYTGATTVNGGSIIVAGSISGSSAITVNSGGTLTASGTIGAVNVVGGILDPGISLATGKLTATGNVTFDSNGHLAIQLGATTSGNPLMPTAGTDYDQLSLSTGRSLLLNGVDLQLSLGSGFTLTKDALFVIVNVATNGMFFQGSQITFNGNQFNILYGVDSTGQTVGNDVLLQAVPEPQTWAMMIGGLGVLLGSQRLRRRSMM